MRTFVRFFLFSILAVLILGSCQLGNDLFNPGAQQGMDGARSVVLPPGAQLVSARLSLSVLYTLDGSALPQTVTVHRVTAPWDENTVTWNSFAGAYDPAVVAAFDVSGPGRYDVDITELVRAWIAGTYPNNGILLAQGQTPYTCYASSENADSAARPSLRLEFVSFDGGGAVSTLVITDSNQTNDIPDAAIWGDGGYWADQNLGANEFFATQLYSGSSGDILKQSLVGFDLVATPESGGTYTIGYWKNHAGFGRQADVVTPLLSVWLGAEGGAKSVDVNSAALAVQVLQFKTFGGSSNGIAKLYAQLLAAKLSIKGGAGGAAVAGVIALADAFLAGTGWQDWASLSSSERSMVLGWASTLDAYNNGIIGPGHGEG